MGRINKAKKALTMEWKGKRKETTKDGREVPQIFWPRTAPEDR